MTLFNSHDSVTTLAVRQVAGLGQVLWDCRRRFWRIRARKWHIVDATIAGREFLRFAANAGWLSLSYTYRYGEQLFSGEFRKWIISHKTSTAESDPETIAFSKRFPENSIIRVRVDPRDPTRSVVDTASFR
jgi:hypothetical protein